MLLLPVLQEDSSTREKPGLLDGYALPFKPRVSQFAKKCVGSAEPRDGTGAVLPGLVPCTGWSEPTGINGTLSVKPVGSEPGFCNQPLCITSYFSL